jgi:Ca2+-binding EF-hand superfamily protein
MRFSTLIATMLVSGGALAADATISASPPPPQAQSFAALDTNRDGQLSFSEAFSNPQLGNAFNVLDSSADGQLSRGEVSGIVR